MNINDYILKEIKSFTLKSTVKSAQKLCKDLPISHIQIIENGKLLGLFAESDVQTIEDKNHLLGEYYHLLDIFFADEKDSVLDLLKLFADNDCNIIPVLNKDKNYIGYYELSDILDLFSSSPFLHDESITLVIEKAEKEYSMSEVAQIAETNNAKILGIYVSKQTNEIIQLTLKIATKEVNEIIQTYRRYNYIVISQLEDDFYLEDLKNRSDYLQKYLNM
jgi:predicted transcriptional regulator